MQEVTDVLKVPQELILPFPGKLTAMQEFTDVLKTLQERVTVFTSLMEATEPLTAVMETTELTDILKVTQEFTDLLPTFLEPLKAPQEPPATAESVLLSTLCRYTWARWAS